MDFLLNRRVTICMLFIASTLLGYVSYKQLPVELLPNAELPVLYVSVSRRWLFRSKEPSVPLEVSTG
jgi:multidrug efflux pump subunit AcrB